jgi:hypothetical protein
MNNSEVASPETRAKDRFGTVAVFAAVALGLAGRLPLIVLRFRMSPSSSGSEFYAAGVTLAAGLVAAFFGLRAAFFGVLGVAFLGLTAGGIVALSDASQTGFLRFYAGPFDPLLAFDYLTPAVVALSALGIAASMRPGANGRAERRVLGQSLGVNVAMAGTGFLTGLLRDGAPSAVTLGVGGALLATAGYFAHVGIGERRAHVSPSPTKPEPVDGAPHATLSWMALVAILLLRTLAAVPGPLPSGLGDIIAPAVAGLVAALFLLPALPIPANSQAWGAAGVGVLATVAGLLAPYQVVSIVRLVGIDLIYFATTILVARGTSPRWIPLALGGLRLVAAFAGLLSF